MSIAHRLSCLAIRAPRLATLVEACDDEAGGFEEALAVCESHTESIPIVVGRWYVVGTCVFS